MAARNIPSFKLNTGASIPAIGLGTAAGFSEQEVAAAKGWYLSAIKCGYRHLDTAQIYKNEGYVGAAVRESGIPREEFFVTTKLQWNHYGRVPESLDESLKTAGLDYFDLFLIHFPQAVFYDEKDAFPKGADGSLRTVDSPTFNETWAEMEAVLASGRVKAIGVSNFSIKTLEQLLKTAKVIPAVNQVELHPYLAQSDLVEYCKAKGILVTAYAATGYIKDDSEPVIAGLAAKYKVSAVQVILAWHLSRGVAAVPKSTNAQRQKDNLNLPTLSSEDLARVSSLDRGERVAYKPDKNGKVWGWTYEQLGW